MAATMIISNGYVFDPLNEINGEIKDIFKDSIFTPSCICGLMESKQLIRLSKEGFWLGFQSFFAHALQNHGFTINSQYELFFDFDLKSVTLDPKI